MAKVSSTISIPLRSSDIGSGGKCRKIWKENDVGCCTCELLTHRGYIANAASPLREAGHVVCAVTQKAVSRRFSTRIYRFVSIYNI